MQACARPPLLAALAVLGAGCATPCPGRACERLPEQSTALEACPAGLPRLGMSYPPVSTPAQRALTASQMRALGVRALRLEDRWRNRDPSGTGAFDFTGLDERLAWARSEGLQVLLTLEARAPDSLCGPGALERSCVFELAPFRGYVQRLLGAHPNELWAVQLGNEWQPESGFAGSAEQFAAAHNVLFDEARRLSPDTKVVLGGFSIGALQALSACDGRLSELTLAQPGQCPVRYRSDDGSLDRACAQPAAQQLAARSAAVLAAARYDLLDVHLYDDAERWPTYLELLRARYGVTTPVIASEVGGPNLLLECYSDAYQAARLATSLRVLATLGLEQAYYFKLVEDPDVNAAHVRSGLMRQTGDAAAEPKPAFAVFEAFARCAPP